MRPLKLVVQGFKPFKERQEIDFSRLEFFVIRGPTGSGKSSILDAISFALFGDTVSGVKQDELINRNSSRFYIDFTFSVGGKVYRIERWRQRGKGGEFRFYENNVRRVFRSDALKREIRRILGVDAEQFRKIFFLPQGRYAEFFHSRPAERRELLVSLLDLTVYGELTEKLKERLAEVEREISNLEGRLAALADATPQRLEELKKEREKLTLHLGEIKGKLSTLEEDIKKLSLLVEKVKRRETLKGEIKKLLGGEYLKLKEEVEKLKPLKGLLPTLQKYLLLEGELRKLQGEREKLLQEVEGLKEELQSAERKREQLKGEEEKLREAEKRAERYRKLLGFLDALEPLYQKLAEEKRRIQNLKGEIETFRKTYMGLKAEIETLEGRVEELNRRLEGNPYNPERETELRLTLQRCEERDRLLSERKRVEEDLQKVLRVRETLQRRLEEVEKKLSEVERKLEEYRRREREYLVYLLVKDLKEGDPCPVCGKPIDRLDSHFEGDFDPEGLKRLEEEREKLLQKRGEIEKKLAVAGSQIENLQRRIEELKNLLGEVENLPPTEEVKEAIENLLRAKKERETLEGELEKVKNLLEEKRRKLASTESALKEKVETLQRLKEDFETRKGKLREDLQKIVKEIGEKPPKEKNPITYLRSLLGGKLETFERKRREFETLQRELENTLSTLRTRLEERRKLLEEVETKLATLRGEVEKLLLEMEKKGFDPTQDPKGLVERLEQLPQMEQRLENYEREIAALRAELDSLERELKDIDSKGVEERLTALEGEHQTLKGEEEKTITRLGGLDEAIETLKGRIEEKLQLEEELQKLQREFALLKTVREDFKSDRLIKFVVDRAMEELIELAGEYLYKLSERYRFELEEGEIKVEDQFMGAVRDIKTLSGGETFLASLSFALALGDYLGRDASVESLFIDEGFGTLDREKLDRIGELFEKLRHSVDKVVGVITHLDELALRFDQRIEVVPSPNGSRIKVVF